MLGDVPVVPERTFPPGDASLGRHEGYRVWKGFDWAAMNRLHEKGYITDPVSKAHSVLLTEEGARESARLLEALFSRTPGAR